MGSTVEFRLSVANLAETVFTFSPLTEATLSLRAWKFPGLHPEHTSGLRRLRAAYATLDTELLGALVTGHRFIPDFLTPRPVTALPEPATEFAALRRTPPERVRKHLLRAYRGGPLPPVLAGTTTAPAAMLARIADALEAYWQRCLAPSWPRMRALLEADIAYRGRTLAAGGAQALFADLDDEVSWRDGTLRVSFRVAGLDRAVTGRGLVLAPCLFVRRTLSMLDPAEQPLLVYPARGRAALWDQPANLANAALDELLGTARSRLLAMLDQPLSTTDLARLLGVTPGAVNRHLTALHAARLLNRARSGRKVLYFRSPLGDALLN